MRVLKHDNQHDCGVMSSFTNLHLVPNRYITFSFVENKRRNVDDLIMNINHDMGCLAPKQQILTLTQHINLIKHGLLQKIKL